MQEINEPKFLLGSSHCYFSHRNLGKGWQGKNMRFHFLTRTWGTLQWCLGVFLWMVFNQSVCLYFLSPLPQEKAFCFQDHMHSIPFSALSVGHGHWEGQATQVGFLGSSIQSQPTSKSRDVMGVRGGRGEEKRLNKPAQIRWRFCLMLRLTLPAAHTHS